jgi:hypothetical protein
MWQTTAVDADYPYVDFACPHCGAPARVTQVQGDRCPGCGFEFKWYGAVETYTAADFQAAVSGATHFLALEPGLGYIVAHE